MLHKYYKYVNCVIEYFACPPFFCNIFRNILIYALACAAVSLLTGCSLSLPIDQDTEAQDTQDIGWEAIPEGQSAEELASAADKEAAAQQEGLSAEETDTPADGEDGDEETGDTPEEVVTVGEASMTGSEEAIALVTSFMEEWGLDSSNCSIAYQNLETGELFYYNETRMWDGCSTYKLPLNLLYYDMEAAGTITADTIIPGTDTTLAECHHQSLEFSNNELSEAMISNLGNYIEMKRSMLQYFTVTEDEVPDEYYNHNYFSARMMMDAFCYLYARQEQYQEALGYLEAAQPGEYFKTYITDITIAQKYGLRDGYTHCAGILFDDTPFVLSVYSYQAGGSNMIGSLAQVFRDYTAGTEQEED